MGRAATPGSKEELLTKEEELIASNTAATPNMLSSTAVKKPKLARCSKERQG
jgi:hypothetical protein